MLCAWIGINFASFIEHFAWNFYGSFWTLLTSVFEAIVRIETCILAATLRRL